MKKIEKLVTRAVLGIVMLSGTIYAQSNKYDPERSKLVGEWLFAKRTSSIGPSQTSTVGSDLSIRIDDSQITLEYHRSNGQIETLIFNANEKGETNTTKLGNYKSTTVSNTRWEKGKLVRRYMIDCNGCIRRKWERIVETYSVSKDGNTLVITEERPSILAELTSQIPGPDAIDVTTRKYKRKP